MSEVAENELRQTISVLQDIEDGTLPSGLIDKGFLKDFRYSRDIENDKKTMSKSTQANLDRYIWDKELSNEAPSKNFWKVVAEKRRVALSKALSDNEELHKRIDALTEENAQFKDKLDEANSFIEVCKELLEEDGDDTGIDVGDLSQCNGAIEN
ncbi:geminin [Manduca sexta]|uniref:Geminin n=1 Tax=Manduca sexta TaxID=7130 RepID=A0A921ZG51_MANSE|nr:geminin [Manduca sexta]KAG6457124.1 hypothetical protein O3G_MSEX010127 [Manduca sexta]